MSGRILIVDDEEVIRRVLRNALEGCGYEVVEASNGREAVLRLGEQIFNVAVTDILMPEQDGLETLLHVRKRQPDTKVIAITRAADKLHLDNARGLGAARVFTKPFKLAEILAAVEDLTQA